MYFLSLTVGSTLFVWLFASFLYHPLNYNIRKDKKVFWSQLCSHPSGLAHKKCIINILNKWNGWTKSSSWEPSRANVGEGLSHSNVLVIMQMVNQMREVREEEEYEGKTFLSHLNSHAHINFAQLDTQTLIHCQAWPMGTMTWTTALTLRLRE